MASERHDGAELVIDVRLPNGGRLTAEDVALIEAIRSVRSILGASRRIDRSYRKTWLMVDALNRSFESRVIETFPGRRGAGAEPTPFGERLVALYRSIERRAARAAEAALTELAAASDPAFESAATAEVPEAMPDRPSHRSLAHS